ncbi:protein PTHB1-like [Physella acuta]|uniref:protein PTHB1-like n=1 Tax=Physella acuta TaxID=109671 RepID=UPI0027DE8B2D|nr:protein PTHB1-like [Physella acuta]XP_059177175.1 protein PTHB1-like [Physella acuta]XP_059177176.1 protein PTHB1-like [Physella acuta]XP_059177177.1 protein PTHB1-like [Physella acuta]
MSLFKTRDWWSASVGEDEEFDLGCMCIGNIDNSTHGYDKVVIGSYQGVLRIYNPNPNSSTNGVSSAEDLVLEQAFKQPILQVEIGKFSSASEVLKLAVLHPRKIAVYNTTEISGTVEHGSQYQFSLLYEHTLQRTAFNFCYGPFGGVKGKDFLCVQSMDGTVSIFEQESFAFSRFLPGALVPGPIKYLPRLDSFLTASSAWRLESYRYQVLAVASDTAGKDETQNVKSGKKVAVDWSYNIGEQAIDICYMEYSGMAPSILVLGERTIFCLTDNGMLKFAKKLEYDPSCLLPYASLVENKVNYLVGAHTNSLLVYQDSQLKWMAKSQFVPVQLRVGNFNGVRSAVVALSETGRLEVMYLGTDPAIFVPPQVDSRDVNYAALDAEMAHLMKHVKSKSQSSVLAPTIKPEDDLSLHVHVSPNLDDVSLASSLQLEDMDGIPSVTVRIQMKSRLVLENVKLEMICPWPLGCNQSEFTIPKVDPNSPSETFVAVFQRWSGLPSHLYLHISATFSSASGGRRVVTSRANLPSKLVLKPVTPVKTAAQKLTVDTNRPPVSLNELFPDMLGENAGGQGSAIGFQYYGGGPVVTVLASKTSQRYRLQSDQLETMWLPLKELVARLNGHYKKGSQTDFRVSFDGALPLEDYFQIVDHHFELRLAAVQCQDMLAQRAAQFRVIQKRLLTRFKDKTPAPLLNLDTLLEGTYRQILALADLAEETRRAELLAASHLSSGTYLINFLLKLWLDLSEEEFQVLQSAMTPVVGTCEDQGWEESVDAALTHLLRTVLAKSSKDQAVNPSPLALPQDTSRLKKHIALFCDRLGKGVALVDGIKDRGEKSRQVSAAKKDDLDPSETPLSGMLKHRQTNKQTNKKKTLQPLGVPQMDVPVSGQDREFDKKIQKLVPDLDSLTQDS